MGRSGHNWQYSLNAFALNGKDVPKHNTDKVG